MTLDATHTLAVGDRRRVRGLALVSVIMLAVSGLVLASAPSPFAPRVHVRWADGLSDAQRMEAERSFALVEGRHREETTWEYDLVEPAPSNVRALVAHPAVVDTHNIDRVTGEVDADAPTGMTRLARRGVAGWIHSPLFNWFMSLWVSSLLVSALWLQGTREQEQRGGLRSRMALRR